MADVEADVRNESDKSVDEKAVGVTHADSTLSSAHGNLPPDPDANLSKEERAAIVSLICARQKNS